MLKLLIHVTQEVADEAEAEEVYEEIKGELRKYPKIHLNAQTTRKYIPSHLPGTPEEGPPS